MTETPALSQIDIDVQRGSITARPPADEEADPYATLDLDEWLADPQAVTGFVSTLIDLFEDGDATQDGLSVSVDDTSVSIHDQDNTLVEWRCAEWDADPALVYTIARAVSWVYENPVRLHTALSAHPSVEEA